MRLSFSVIGVIVLFSLGACSVLTNLPKPATTDERLARIPTRGLPIEAPVEIRWSKEQIPFVIAETDGDAAFGLGLVHAHLRLGQMEVMRRLIQGRLAELAGPNAAKIDVALRTLGIDRAVPEIEAALPDSTRVWIERFAAGINAYVASLSPKELPHEMKVLGIAKHEPWTARDILAGGRLAGVDVTWITYATLLAARGETTWDEVWAAIKASGNASLASFDIAAEVFEGDDRALATLGAVTQLFGRTGSNSVVIGPERSATGSALIANDPHLGFTLPNLWIVAGLKSPSYNIVGMMPPGMPVFGFGRNEHIAWGGTNLRALASDVVDVTDLAADQISERRETIKVRFWRDRTITVRLTPYGPIMSDADALPQIPGKAYALRWMGHQVTDETTALLGAMRATDFEAFTAALETFGMPGQNFLYADRDGHIGQVLAAIVPARDERYFDDVLVDPAVSDEWWERKRNIADLPKILDPQEGALASANNKPTETDRPVAAFFPPDERIRRLKTILETEERFDIGKLKTLQHDVRSPLSLDVNRAILARLDREGVPAGGAGVVELLRAWDGSYTKDSNAAVVFEALYGSLVKTLYQLNGEKAKMKRLGALGLERPLLVRDVDTFPTDVWGAALGPALAAAEKQRTAGTRWGDIHKFRIQHVFANIPVLGSKYRFGERPIAGSRETVMKSGHKTTVEEHYAFYGSQSRHISDLGDPDTNLFVLLGGQDGWLNSANFADQIDVFLAGDYIEVPLRPETVRTKWSRVTRLTPGP